MSRKRIYLDACMAQRASWLKACLAQPSGFMKPIHLSLIRIALRRKGEL